MQSHLDDQKFHEKNSRGELTFLAYHVAGSFSKNGIAREQIRDATVVSDQSKLKFSNFVNLMHFHLFSFLSKLNIHRNQTCISLYVNFDSNNHYNYNYEEFRKKMKKLTLRYEIGIVTWQGGSLSHKTTGEIDFKDTSYFHSIRLGRLINRAELNRMSRDNDNELKIVANLFFIEKQSELTHITSFDMEKNKEIALSNQFEAMFNDDKYSDFTIITSDNEKIHVHRNILSARSVVFDTMLQTTMKENEFNEALINDIDGKSLVEFLRFIYSGKVQSFEGIAADLLYAAHKYEIEDLKPLCVQHLCSNLNLTNVLDTLLISNLHSEEKFKRFCFAFMKM